MTSSWARSYVPTSKLTSWLAAMVNFPLTGWRTPCTCWYSTGFPEGAAVFDGVLAVFGERQDQIAGCVNDWLGACKFQTNLGWVGLRSENKVVFQPALRAVVEQIDTGVHPGISHLAVGLQVPQPFRRIASHKII